MPKEFINPNLHVILIHYPLGLLSVGVLIELFAFLWRRSAFRAAGRWMILIGALALVPTATIGLYAMADVNRRSVTSESANWAEVRAASLINAQAWEMMTRHAWLNAFGSIVLLLVVVLWLGSSDLWRRRLHLIFLLLLLGGLGTIIVGAWYGGEMVYRHGVGVEVVRENSGSATGGSGEQSPAAEEQIEAKHGIAYYAPPLQVHVLLAGAAVSLALAALGLSLRAGAQARVLVEPTPELSDVGAIGSALNPNARPLNPVAAANQMDDATLQVNVLRRPPMTRFWLLAALVAIATSLAGVWTLVHFSDIWYPHDLAKTARELWGLIKEKDNSGIVSRRMAHTLTGWTIIGLLLITAVVARSTIGRRLVLWLLTLLLIVAVGAQIWFGSLLMFDTPSGPLGKFNYAEKQPESPPATLEPTPPAGTVPATRPSTTTTRPNLTEGPAVPTPADITAALTAPAPPVFPAPATLPVPPTAAPPVPATPPAATTTVPATAATTTAPAP